MIQRILQESSFVICVITLLLAPNTLIAKSDELVTKDISGSTQMSEVKTYKKTAPLQQQTQQTTGTPYHITTETLTITGKGAEGLAFPFSPKQITTETLTITGLEDRGLDIPPFTPKQITTETLTITGMGEAR